MKKQPGTNHEQRHQQHQQRQEHRIGHHFHSPSHVIRHEGEWQGRDAGSKGSAQHAVLADEPATYGTDLASRLLVNPPGDTIVMVRCFKVPLIPTPSGGPLSFM